MSVLKNAGCGGGDGGVGGFLDGCCIRTRRWCTEQEPPSDVYWIPYVVGAVDRTNDTNSKHECMNLNVTHSGRKFSLVTYNICP